MDSLTGALAARGYGLTAIPAPGDITVAGALAINAHGSAIPATGETRLPGQTYGSLSNLILKLTAVVWSGTQNGYVLKTFQRDDPDIRAFPAHLGRAVVTEVTLQAGPSQNLRCQSWVNISAADLFAPPASAGSCSTSSRPRSGSSRRASPSSPRGPTSSAWSATSTPSTPPGCPTTRHKASSR